MLDWRLADRVGLRLLRAADEACRPLDHPARLLGALDSAWYELLRGRLGLAANIRRDSTGKFMTRPCAEGNLTPPRPLLYESIRAPALQQR